MFDDEKRAFISVVEILLLSKNRKNKTPKDTAQQICMYVLYYRYRLNLMICRTPYVVHLRRAVSLSIILFE